MLGSAPLFAHRTIKELRMLVVAMEHMSYDKGDVVFAEGDQPNGVYVLDSGACSVHLEAVGVVAELTEPGAVFGELCLFLDANRTASIVATKPTRCFRCSGADAMKVMEDAWGDREELAERAAYLHKVDVFSTFAQAELMLLATGMSVFKYHRPGQDIVKEGTRGENMFFIRTGNPYVSLRSVGRVAELAPGDFFGEVALLDTNSYRTATVTTSDMSTIVYALHRDDVFRLTTPEQREIMLENGTAVYDERAALRKSVMCHDYILLFWQVTRAIT